MDGIAALEEAGWLRRRAAGWFWTRRERASDLADLRSSGGRPVQIIDTATGRVIGTVDASTTCVSKSAEWTTMRSSGMKALICDAGTCTA